MKTKTLATGVAAFLLLFIMSSFMNYPDADTEQFLKRNPETRANFITQMMKSRLELDASQVEKVYAVNLKYARQIQPYVGDLEKMKANRSTLVEINQKRKAELISILSEEQVAAVQHLKKQWINRLEIVLEQLKTEADN